MALIVLVLWIIEVAFGIAVLVRWLASRRPGSFFPTRTVVGHVGSALAGLGLWIAYVVTGSAWWAWAAFVVITLANVLGDTMLTRGFRARTGRSRGWADYGAAIVEALRFRRPLPSVHALFAGVVYFTTLAACIVALL